MNIKKLEEVVQVEDYIILNSAPLKITKYGKEFIIGQVKWMDWEKFTLYMGIFFNHYVIVAKNINLPESINDLVMFRNDLRTTFTHRKAMGAFFKLCKIQKLNIRFMKKHFTVDDMAEFFAYFYLYNVKSVKSNCKTVLKAMGLN
jgi:hypothetical protein